MQRKDWRCDTAAGGCGDGRGDGGDGGVPLVDGAGSLGGRPLS